MNRLSKDQYRSLLQKPTSYDSNHGSAIASSVLPQNTVIPFEQDRARLFDGPDDPSLVFESDHSGTETGVSPVQAAIVSLS